MRGRLWKPRERQSDGNVWWPDPVSERKTRKSRGWLSQIIKKSAGTPAGGRQGPESNFQGRRRQERRKEFYTSVGSMGSDGSSGMDGCREHASAAMQHSARKTGDRHGNRRKAASTIARWMGPRNPGGSETITTAALRTECREEFRRETHGKRGPQGLCVSGTREQGSLFVGRPTARSGSGQKAGESCLWVRKQS